MASERLRLAGLVRPMRAHRQMLARSVAGLWQARGVQLPLLLLLTVLLTAGVYQVLQPQTVQVGPFDRRFIHGANEREFIADLGREVRWTTAETRIDVPLVAARTPLLLDITLVNSYPPGTPPPGVDVVAAERWLTEFLVPRAIAGERHYRLLLPPQERAGWSLPVTLYSSTIELAADPRPIGVMLTAVQLTALGERALLPPLWHLLALVVIAASSYGMLRGIGATHWRAWGLALLCIVALLLALLVVYLQVAPFTMRLAGLSSLGALYGLAVGRLRTPPDSGPATLLAGRTTPIITPTRVVLLMGLAFWLLPVYQLVMTADGAPAVTPYPPTFWIGVLALLGAIIGIGVLFDMGRAHLWERWLLLVLAVAAVVHLVVMIEFALGRSGPDFWILFKGAREWLRGGSMYDMEAVLTNHFGHVFKVPPFYGMLFLPFVEQDGLRILFWHRVLNIALLALTALLLFRAYSVRLVSVLGVGVLLLFNMRPATDTIAFGQIDILLLLLLLLTVVLLQQQRPGLAGAALAVGTMFKLYPALLLVFFVLKREWRGLGGFALAMLLLNGLAVAVVGWEMHRVYLFDVVPNIGGGTTWVENQTINGFLSRLVGGTIDAAIFAHPLVSALTYGAFLLLLAGAVLLVLPPVARRSPAYLLQFSLFPLLMVLTVPAAWMHYQTIVILPLFALLLYSTHTHGLIHWQAALLGLGYGLIAYGNQWSFFDGTITGVLTFAGVSYKFYGLLLVLVVLAALLYGVRRREREEATRYLE